MTPTHDVGGDGPIGCAWIVLASVAVGALLSIATNLGQIAAALRGLAR